jgi:hypothetical protein
MLQSDRCGIKAASTLNGFAAACSGLSTRFADGPDGHDGSSRASQLAYHCIYVGAMGRVTTQRHDKVIFGESDAD